MRHLLFNYTFLFWQVTPSVGWLDMLWMLLQTAIALGLVCGLAVLVFRYILPKLNVVSFNKSIVRIVDGASLDARKRLIVVEVAGKYLLLALSESGVQMVSELDGETVEQAVARLEEINKQSNPQFKKASDSFAQIMDSVWKKRSRFYEVNKQNSAKNFLFWENGSTNFGKRFRFSIFDAGGLCPSCEGAAGKGK